MRWLLVLFLCSVAGAETVTLSPGWNAVGLRVQKVTSVTGGDAVVVWDGSRYVPSTISDGRRGMWIYSISGGTLNYSGGSDGLGDTLTLTSGWNLVAFPGAGEVPGSSVTGGSVLCYETTGDRVDLSAGGRLRSGRAYWVYSASGGRLSWPSPAPTRAWQERPSVLLPGLVSSTTMWLPGGGYRLYHFIPGEFVSRTSADGVTFGPQVLSGLRSAPGTLRDRIKEFSVLRVGSQYVMIYEAVDTQNLSRFFRGTSTDGVTFTGGPDPVLQAEGPENGFIGAPDLVELGGVLYLYYVADRSRTSVASSTDAGLTWTRRGAVSIRGFTGNLTDPDVVALPGGRLGFFALHDGRGVGMTQAVILYATSSDPLTFDFDSVVVSSSTGVLKVNPDAVLQPDGRFLMYYAITRDHEQSFDLYRADSLTP